MRLTIPSYYKLSWMLTGLLVSVITATVLGTPHTIGEAILYQKILFNLLTGGLIWGLILIVVLYFDGQMPWETSPKLKRWFWQIVLSVPGALLIDWYGVHIRNALLGSEYISHIFWYTDFPILILMLLIIQYLFQQAYLKHQLINPEPEPARLAVNQAQVSFAAHISLKKASKTYQIPVAEIAYLHRQDQVNFLRQFDGKEWIWDQSLSALESQLDPKAFFRVNRQLLLNRNAILSYEVLGNRQTLINLQPALANPAFLNKNRLAQFKQWFHA